MSDRDPLPLTHEGKAIAVGDEFDVVAGKVAHGGHVIARIDHVVAFVRGALPGESVRVKVTEVRAKFVRADVVEVQEPHAERRIPLCAVAGECGGCDFQHASESLQRQMKSSVLHESLIRHGKITERRAEQLLGEGVIDLGPGTGWRTRMRYRVAPGPLPGSDDTNHAGQVLGMYRHRSDVLVDASSCVIAHPAGHDAARRVVEDLPLGTEIVMAAGEDGCVVMVEGDAGRRGSDHVRHRIRIDADFLDFRVPATGFWQVHPGLGQAIIDRILEVASPQAGEHWWDLYAGAGPIAAALGSRVGERGRVDAVESSAVAVEHGKEALEAMPWVRWHRGDVLRWLSNRPSAGNRSRSRGKRSGLVHGVVLDPPRSGAGAKVLQPIARRSPRVIVVVACDPVALGRDTAVLGQLGYELHSVRAWDAFPQTHHMETLATFEPRDQIS